MIKLEMEILEKVILYIKKDEINIFYNINLIYNAYTVFLSND